jgi:single-stranded-DNA-specific exonuclease
MIWTQPIEVEIPQEFAGSIGGHPLVAQTLYRRGYQQVHQAIAFLDPSCYQVTDSQEFPELGRAIGRLQRAMSQKEKILVWGDFDVDGQTATSLLVSVLQHLQAEVSYYIPVRSEESHGINPEKLKKLLSEGFKILLTCDTGIAENQAVALANDQGTDVIITDHHEIPRNLPAAFAIINPRLLAETHPFHTLPGVGVAYELGVELLRQAGEGDQADALLDLVALGIVADLALLKGETRYLLQKGLKVLRETSRVGIRAILERIDIDPSGLNEEQIGFLIAPRLNALGRLADANLAVELLITQDMGKARLLALQLETLNAKRRLLTSNVFEGAMAQIRSNPHLLKEPVLVLSNPDWPAGVIGIVASRLVERYAKPAILIAMGEDGLARGSARSIEGLNITSALSSVSDILSSTGGHPMAAGFSLPWDKLPEFKKSILQQFYHLDKISEEILEIDGFLPLRQLSFDLVSDLERLSPFGPGNLPLTLVSKNVQIRSSSTLGREEEHLLLNILDEDMETAQKVIWWHGAGWELPEGKFDLAYRVRTSSSRGLKEVLVEWIDYQSSQEKDAARLAYHLPKILDYRAEPHPLTLLKMMKNQKDTEIFAEGEAVKKLAVSGITTHTRLEIRPCETLILWNSPPGPEVLKEILKLSKPASMVLFDEQTGIHTVVEFVNRLVGLVRYMIRMHQGRGNLRQLASLTAQREITIQKGLLFLEEEGFIKIESVQDGEIKLELGELSGDKKEGNLFQRKKTSILAELEASITETNAYRRYYRLASPSNLIQFDLLDREPGNLQSERKSSN